MATFWRTIHHDGKISSAWWGGGARPPPFTLSIITSKVVVYSTLHAAESADTLPLFPFYLYILSV
jgi:hypothetical protein